MSNCPRCGTVRLLPAMKNRQPTPSVTKSDENEAEKDKP